MYTSQYMFLTSQNFEKKKKKIFFDIYVLKILRLNPKNLSWLNNLSGKFFTGVKEAISGQQTGKARSPQVQSKAPLLQPTTRGNKPLQLGPKN